MRKREVQPNDFYVYLHLKADNGVPFYVGKGRNRRAWIRNGRSAQWTRTVAKHGLIVMIIKGDLAEEVAFALEKDWIFKLGRGFLCNHTDGGEGMWGNKKSAETIAKLSASLMGRAVSEETRALIGAKHKGKIVSEDTRRKLSELNIGKLPSVETLKKRSVALKGRVFSEEHKQKISQALTGKVRTEAQIAKMRTRNLIPVKCSNGMTFPSFVAARDWLRSIGFDKAGSTGMVRCCKGYIKSAYGFEWSYVEA